MLRFIAVYTVIVLFCQHLKQIREIKIKRIGKRQRYSYKK